MTFQFYCESAMWNLIEGHSKVQENHFYTITWFSWTTLRPSIRFHFADSQTSNDPWHVWVILWTLYVSLTPEAEPVPCGGQVSGELKVPWQDTVFLHHCKWVFTSSYTVFETYDCVNYCDLEIRVRGHLWSSKLVPCDSLPMISYHCPIVTLWHFL